MKIGNWEVKRNNKVAFDVWNDKIKIGFYAILKTDNSWLVRRYTDKAFSAIDLEKFNSKEEAFFYILHLMRIEELIAKN